MKKARKYLLIGAAVIVIVVAVLGGAVSDRVFGYRVLDRFFPPGEGASFRVPTTETQRILREESVVIEVAERVSPSVVTVSLEKTTNIFEPFRITPFGFEILPQERQETVEQDIATGFIISADGLIVTNKHVVADTQASYKVITNDDQAYEVEKIYRDPVNDMAILKIEALGLTPVEMGDSDNLKVGQFVIAIGTALGEFRHTVTTGVISGLGRGITAGSPFEGYVERIDNVIQTDAAINPGNSGGPLLNSGGQVIGVSVAIAAAGENIGFAFNKTGQFMRPYLGVRYRIISQDLALMNEVPQGAYIVEVIEGSAADKAGVKPGDIITQFDGQAVKEEDGGLAKLISTKKVGDRIELVLWRDGEEIKATAVLEEIEG
jgi:S1-C subfamily serine protease